MYSNKSYSLHGLKDKLPKMFWCEPLEEPRILKQIYFHNVFYLIWMFRFFGTGLHSYRLVIENLDEWQNDKMKSQNVRMMFNLSDDRYFFFYLNVYETFDFF